MNDEQSEIEDRLLVMEAQAGDEDALDKIIRRWQKRLWGHAFRLTGDRQAAWDVSQESWLGIIKGLRKLHDAANFKAWAYRITTNKAIDWVRKNKGAKQVEVEEIGDRQGRNSNDSGLMELLQLLDVRKRAVLSLYYLEQFSVGEISIALKIPKGTVKSRLYSARNELKLLWQQNE